MKEKEIEYDDVHHHHKTKLVRISKAAVLYDDGDGSFQKHLEHQLVHGDRSYITNNSAERHFLFSGDGQQQEAERREMSVEL